MISLEDRCCLDPVCVESIPLEATPRDVYIGAWCAVSDIAPLLEKHVVPMFKDERPRAMLLRKRHRTQVDTGVAAILPDHFASFGHPELALLPPLTRG